MLFNKPNFMRLLQVIVLVVFVSWMSSCRKDEPLRPVPPRDFAVQYETDIDTIEKYLKAHYMIVDAQGNVQMFKITNPDNQVSVWDQQDFPLQFISVKNDNRLSNFVDGRVDDPVDYKLFYILLNQGGGDRPSVVDDVMTTYRGWRLDNVLFDSSDSPVWFEQQGIVSGFRQIVARLNAATGLTENGDGTVNFENFGNVVVFIPSGLGYFNAAPASVGAYNPIVFQIKLKRVFYRDHDNDGILSKNELYGEQTNLWLQDSDGDNIPDFLDTDDDGDRTLTKVEITNQAGEIIPFDLIPDCNGNTSNPSRLKKHLDPTCQ
jgi:FKBP-type peptidyl-prolyl cis-trans isomerase FkpA